MDGYSRAWMESSAGQSALARREEARSAAQENKREYDRLKQIADEKARLLDIDPSKLSKKYFDDLFYRSYEYFSFSEDIVSNLQDVFPDEASSKIELSLQEEYRGRYYLSKETKDFKQEAIKRRVSNYFYEDIKDFNKEGMLDTFISYIEASHDYDCERLAQNPALSDEHIKTIVNHFQKKDDFMQCSLLMAHPHAFTPEQADEILQQKWFLGAFDYYLDEQVPVHMGMAPEDVAWRQNLDKAYREVSGKSIYDVEFFNKSYFDVLLKCKKVEELFEEYPDRYIDYIKTTENFDSLVSSLVSDDNGILADTPLNKKIIGVLDSFMTKNNELKLAKTQNGQSYLYYRILNGSLKNQDVIKKIGINSPYNNINIVKLFNNSSSLDKVTLKSVYQAAWLYNKGDKTPDVLKKEYGELFGENIEDVRETVDWEYPIGSSRLDILVKNRDARTLAKYNMDYLLSLSLDKLDRVIEKASVSLTSELELSKGDEDLFHFYDTYIDKFGFKNIAKYMPYDTFENVLALRYISGKKDPKEISALRSSNLKYSALENLFAKEGDTLFQIKDFATLIEKDESEKIDIINKRNDTIKDEDKKYEVFNQAIKSWYFLDEAQKKKYIPYIRDFVQKHNIDFFNADLHEHFEAGKMLHFMIYEYEKDQNVSKKTLTVFLEKARRKQEIRDDDLKKMQQLGFSFKTEFAYDLIRYSSKHRTVDINLEGRDLSQYDFETPFLLDRSYQPSSGSHTTFLNETLQYWEGKAAVTALNNGASPFTKAGFFRDKFYAMPFNMMFSKALKENKTTELKDFMGYIAANLDESKKGVLKDIWTSLGQKLRDDTRVQSIIKDTDKVLNSRDFVQEKIDKQLKLKAEEERRKKEEEERRKQEEENRKQEEERRKQEEERARIEHERRLAEEKRMEEERRIAEEKRKREEAIATLKQNVLASMPDIISMDNKKITEKIAQYLEQNKDNLSVMPNADELSAIKIAAFEKKTEELKLKQIRDEEKKTQMAKAIRKAIKEKEKENASFFSPQDVKEFVTKYFEEDTEATPFVGATIKKFSEEAQEKAEIQKKLDKADKVVADKLLDFYEADNIYGFNFFNEVGKERCNQGYTNIAISVMHEMDIPVLLDDEDSKDQVLFDKVKNKVINLIDKTEGQHYYDEENDIWVDNRYDFLADIAGYEPAEPKVDEKELIKQAKKEVKKNKKGESIVNSLAGLAALKDKFNSGK